MVTSASTQKALDYKSSCEGLPLNAVLSKILAKLELALRINWSTTDEEDEASFEIVAARPLLLEVAALPRCAG